jgi:hypothetical protein
MLIEHDRPLARTIGRPIWGSLDDDQRALFYRPWPARRAIAKSIERHRALSPDVTREPESLARRLGRAGMSDKLPTSRLILDRLRSEHYSSDATTTEEAMQKVQNDQWQEALDDDGVTPTESLVELSRVMIVEPATADGQRPVAYWQAIDDDPKMVVLVESIDCADAVTPELLASVRAGGIMSNTFVFGSLAMALDYCEADTADGERSCIVLARRIDEPDFGERPAGELC